MISLGRVPLPQFSNSVVSMNGQRGSSPPVRALNKVAGVQFTKHWRKRMEAEEVCVANAWNLITESSIFSKRVGMKSDGIGMDFRIQLLQGNLL